MRRKKSPKTKAREKAWKMFSKYIRLHYADDQGYVRCVTCGVKKYWKEVDAGHYVDGRRYAVLFDEMLVHPQCVQCNRFLHGNKIKYTAFMVSKYEIDIEECNQLDNLKKQVKKMHIADFKEIEEKYTDLFHGECIKRGMV